MKTFKTFGENLKRIRKAQGLTQKKLAENADIAQTIISHFEIDVREPRLQHIRKLCLALNCSPTALITF